MDMDQMKFGNADFTVTDCRLHAELPSTNAMSLEAMPISFCVKGLWLKTHS
jgi:hypothetical protein